MPPRRMFRFVSIAIHAVVLAWVIATPLIDLGPLPTPHTTLIAFEPVSIAGPIDIPLPPPQRGATAASPDATVAPIAPPEKIAPEVSVTPARRATTEGTVQGGVEHGIAGGIEGLGASAIGVLPPAPQPPVRVHAGIHQPQKLVHVAPQYPPAARAARVQGVVVLEAVIDASGAVQSVRVLRSIALLDQAAIDAVRQWRFTPTLLNGQAVPIIMTITVNFTLQVR